jgi:hypothetical protein
MGSNIGCVGMLVSLCGCGCGCGCGCVCVCMYSYIADLLCFEF